ncbi:hypothetical protein HPP92_003136 [Vanilla planifolia]|uniref:Uncharacterized protein n=1 Tax=Vanilla planifolia TaxID=51239 RepID=A0A835VJL2_VANPL|nr:hypothetical protein HPP92_027819 [Vanilla planifolia]KAG0503064.1 hypothetical protein HPP92_003136 [Vanilla planifolia]
MEWDPAVAASHVDNIEEIGDSEENRLPLEDEDDVDDVDDAESCVTGSDGNEDGRCDDDDDDEGERRCVSWRMWCILGHQSQQGRGGVDVWDGSMSKSATARVDEAEENRLFWETCLAEESSIPQLF